MKEERSLGAPLFPRLHVNDADKGGPRAPPRNKMALYEQLSVPTPRSNSGSASTLPLSHKASSIQGGGCERSIAPQFYSSPPMPAHSTEKVQSCSSNTPVVGCEWNPLKDANFPSVNASELLASTAECSYFPPHDFSKLKNSGGKKLEDEEVGFRVPGFIHSRVTPSSSIYQHSYVMKRLPPTSTIDPGCSTVLPRSGMLKTAATFCSSSMQLNRASDLLLKGSNSKISPPGQHAKNQNMDNLVVSTTSVTCSGKSASHLLPGEKSKTDEHLKNTVTSGQDHHSSPVDDLGSAHDMDAQLHQAYRFGLLQESTACSNGVSNESQKLEKRNVSSVRRGSCTSPSLRNNQRSLTEIERGNEHCKDKACRPSQTVDVDGNDDISEASMVESISGMEMTADDVVDMIGQQHFWKARRVIVNQQRAFAMQVFELHRLIEVQRLFAGLPNLLLEENIDVNEPSLKASLAKKLPNQCVLKPETMKHKYDSQKQNQSSECADENTVENNQPIDGISKGLAQHSTFGTQHSNCCSYSGNAPPAIVPADNNGGPWSCHPPLGNQWLVPVMSPSEGLIYKPYGVPFPPNTGFMAPIYGGCGPINASPMEGCFLNPTYGAPATHPQGISVPSITHPAAHTFPPPTYFPSYGMPVLNPVNLSTAFSGTALPGARMLGQAEQLSAGDIYSQHQSNSLNHGNQPASSYVGKPQASKGSERHGSTASHPSAKALEEGADRVSEGRNALPLFPMDLALEKPLQPHNQQKSVIRVVPHNPISATESAARIFQSIQAERRRYDTA